ncbi:MCP four helix bundle domain-containing protein, partial [Curvibacter sp. HBC28]
MSFLRQLKIGARLGLCLGLLLLFLCTVGGVGLYEIKRVNANAQELGSNWMPSIKSLGEVRASMNEVRRIGLRHVLEELPDNKKQQTALHEQALKVRTVKAFESYEKLISSPEERKLWDDTKALWSQFSALDARQIQLSEVGAAEERQARSLATGETGQVFAQVLASLTKLIELNEKGALQATTQADHDYRMALTLTSSLMVVAMGLGLLFAVLLTRSILVPIQEAVNVAETVAGGDLTSTIHIEGRDEAAALLLALQHMNDRLVDVVSQVRHSSDSIATGSAEIATGNADLSQRTESQASNLEETAASMEELTSTVKTNADTA